MITIGNPIASDPERDGQLGIVVPGGGVDEQGQPHEHVRARLDRAVELYRAAVKVEVCASEYNVLVVELVGRGSTSLCALGYAAWLMSYCHHKRIPLSTPPPHPLLPYTQSPTIQTTSSLPCALCRGSPHKSC